MKKSAEPAPEGAGGEYEIVIAADGRVLFRTQTAEMLEIARALAPEDSQGRPAAGVTPEGKEDEIRATGRD